MLLRLLPGTEGGCGEPAQAGDACLGALPPRASPPPPPPSPLQPVWPRLPGDVGTCCPRLRGKLNSLDESHGTGPGVGEGMLGVGVAQALPRHVAGRFQMSGSGPRGRMTRVGCVLEEKALVKMAEVPEAFVEVTVSSTGELRSLGSHCTQKTLHKSVMQEDRRVEASLGGFPIHNSELLTRLDRGEVAWVPELHSSDESADEGPVKPTLKRWPKGGAWWERYRSPAKYPSSDSSSSDDDQRSEVEDEKPPRGGRRLTILRRSILDSSKGNGSPNKIHENKRYCEYIKSLRQKRANHLAELEGIHTGPNLYKGWIRKQSITRKSHQKSHTEGKYNKCIYSQGKRRGGLPANTKPQATSKIAEDNFLEDTRTSETEAQAVLGKGSNLGASEQQKMQTKVHVKISRKSKKHSQQNNREVSASQTVQPGKRLREEDEPQKNSKKVCLQSCEMARVGWQSTSRAMPRRKSKRKVCLAGQQVRFCFCQKEEGSKMALGKIASNSRVCKKSPNSQVLGKEPEDIANSQRTQKCQAYNSSDQAEPHSLPAVPRNDVEQNISRIQMADGLSDGGLQQVRTASFRQQREAQPMSPGEPFSHSREAGGGCTEDLRKTTTEPQSGAHQRKAIASQLQAIEIQDKYTPAAEFGGEESG
ncbi:hypothetical protein JRQ81_003340 [Phrynocephalus forsythii]|uniref:KRAB domain-containing protein n=1 Tax=Phrynocephalus forsythii TaxID=171643 RepID=A0A9Q0XJN0_9SAUR|nr:hypothetical protein JRQ81_003340 [Phrynocephalus forsythii]